MTLTSARKWPTKASAALNICLLRPDTLTNAPINMNMSIQRFWRGPAALQTRSTVMWLPR